MIDDLCFMKSVTVVTDSALPPFVKQARRGMGKLRPRGHVLLFSFLIQPTKLQEITRTVKIHKIAVSHSYYHIILYTFFSVLKEDFQ